MSPGAENARGPRIVMVGQQVEDEKFVAALDIGTTTIRCHVYDRETRLRGSATDQVELLYPQVGYAEIDPEKLWQTSVKVIGESIKDAGLRPDQISCLGISVQRSSFTTWHQETGVPFHNIITWRDLRANKIVYDMNKSVVLKSVKMAAKLLYYATKNKRFLAGSQMKIMNTQVTPRLLWVLQNVAVLREAVSKNKACFGTIDSWLVYKLTAGKLHVTDVSNAACTGFFDPFTMDWASWAFHIFGVPQKILPQILDTSDDYGTTATEIFGAPIPIRSIVADQSAATFGSCNFEEHDVKITLGTGSFVDVNTGKSPHASISGIYPIVGWRIKGETIYLAEGASNDTGTTIRWAQNIGLIQHPAESSDMAKTVEDTDGVCFIPSFSGIQAPVNDGLAAAGLIGIKPTTSRNHMIRAILESIVFRIDQLFEVVRQERGDNFRKIRIDGGVSNNDFIVQLIADLTQVQVERPESTEMSVLGAAYLAGLYTGVWKSKEELFSLRKVDRVFQPRYKVKEDYEERIKLWRNAITRFLNWYPEQSY